MAKKETTKNRAIDLLDDEWERDNKRKAREDFEKISAIANRAMDLLEHWEQDKTTWMMDLEAAHETVGLKLDELLSADNGNFLHDVTGISNHMNRETGKLEDCFQPRYAI